MKTFAVDLARYVLERTRVTIQAETEDEAYRLALWRAYFSHRDVNHPKPFPLPEQDAWTPTLPDPDHEWEIIDIVEAPTTEVPE